jgi:hypothetical protein
VGGKTRKKGGTGKKCIHGGLGEGLIIALDYFYFKDLLFLNFIYSYTFWGTKSKAH